MGPPIEVRILDPEPTWADRCWLPAGGSYPSSTPGSIPAPLSNIPPLDKRTSRHPLKVEIIGSNPMRGTNMWGVRQAVTPSAFQVEEHRFESDTPYHTLVAQWIRAAGFEPARRVFESPRACQAAIA